MLSVQGVRGLKTATLHSHLPPVTIGLLADARVDIAVRVSAERVDGDDAIRGECLGEPSEVVDRGVAGGVVLDERDVVVAQEGGEALAGRFAQVARPQRPGAARPVEGAGVGEAFSFAGAEQEHVTGRICGEMFGEEPVGVDVLEPVELGRVLDADWAASQNPDS